MEVCMASGVRRIVTGRDSSGKAVVLYDGEAPNVSVRPVRRNVSRLIWTTGGAPADISGDCDRGALPSGTSPAPCGSVFRIIDYPPATPESEKLELGHRLKQLEGESSIEGLPPRHPFMHRTRTIDYAIVLSGEIDMLLDDSEVHLTAGDVLVQQGTNHAWVNRGSETCRIVFVLIDAKDPAAG
jgi:mannose-6-phosphate isomerase-like protein (cupin superfamily)